MRDFSSYTKEELITILKHAYNDANALQVGDECYGAHSAAEKRGYYGHARSMYTLVWLTITERRTVTIEGPYLGPSRVTSIGPSLEPLVINDEQTKEMISRIRIV